MVNVMNYYMLGTIERPVNAVAYTIGEPPISYELIPALEGKNSLPFDLVLKRATISKNGITISDDLSSIKHVWQDYLPNCLAWPIMSEKMKEIIEANITGEEGIDWLDVNISSGKEQRKYYVLRFNKELDVLDVENTTFVPGTDHIVIPYFSLEKLGQLRLFYVPEPFGYWKIPSGIYIDQVLKDAFTSAGLTGIEFEEVSSYRITQGTDPKHTI